jgi:tRNA dimethylallyltransferase
MGQKAGGINREGARMDLLDVPSDRPVLVAGPTASGKSALALSLARRGGGVIVNADLLQVYEGWRVLSARPSPEEEAGVPHALYGHVAMDAPYSVGHWLREVAPLLGGPLRPIVVGGAGLAFAALTEGLAEVPPVPPEVRAEADGLALTALRAGLDEATRSRVDLANRARVQRAWEVLRATGRGLAAWQAETPPPLLPLARAHAVLLRPDVAALDARIARRFDAMLEGGPWRRCAPSALMAGGSARLPRPGGHRAARAPPGAAHARGGPRPGDPRHASLRQAPADLGAGPHERLAGARPGGLIGEIDRAAPSVPK